MTTRTPQPPPPRREARVRWRLPQGLALDRDGAIATAEFSNDRVVVMDRHGRHFPRPFLLRRRLPRKGRPLLCARWISACVRARARGRAQCAQSHAREAAKTI